MLSLVHRFLFDGLFYLGNANEKSVSKLLTVTLQPLTTIIKWFL
jgi:hypothetical protein